MTRAQQPLRFAAIGIGGYALDHIRAVDWLAREKKTELTAVIALEADRQKNPELVAGLQQRGVRLFDSIDHFFADGAGLAEVLTVPIGIHQHVPVSIQALQAGLHVFCEKPVAATVQEVDRLIEVQRSTGRRVAIGFQYIPTLSIQRLKSRICEGRLGQLLSASLICMWPRSENYYARNNWAGRLRLGDAWVLDTPANNAVSHFLFNLLYLISSDPQGAAEPVRVEAELFRANRIESADLTQLRFSTADDVDGYVVFAHCSRDRFGPVLEIVAEQGNVLWQGDWGETTIRYRNGETEAFVNPNYDAWRYEIFADFVDSLREDRAPICPPELARAHTLTIDAMHESCPQIVTVPEKYIDEIEGVEDYPPRAQARFRRIADLDGAMHRAYASRRLFSELGLPWAQSVRSAPFSTRGYDRFPRHVNIG